MVTADQAANKEFMVVKTNTTDQIIALAGNPNVGKSTVFNALTGMNQHTGNWPGKTVGSAQGTHHHHGSGYIFVDLPGTYSIMAHSAEEEIARDFILFGGADATVVVCDATCLERNLNLVLQVMELTANVVVCVNLLDEAEKKGILIDLEALERELGVPVVGASARSGKGLAELMEKVEALCAGAIPTNPRGVRYNSAIERAVSSLALLLEQRLEGRMNSHWLALRVLEQDTTLAAGIKKRLGPGLLDDEALWEAADAALASLEAEGISREKLGDMVVSCIVFSAEEIALSVGGDAAGCAGCGRCGGAVVRAGGAADRDRRLDKVLTSRRTGIPIMLALLCGILWLTITGANYPSRLLSDGLFWVQDRLTGFFCWAGSPDWLYGALVLGVYRVLAWVVAVMLPPMAIFFPLFTLLEDFGYLPRVAFNLDHQFKKAKACGKQALTMWIG